MDNSTFRHPRLLPIAMAIVFAVSAPALANKIIVDWNHDLDMAGWKSFRWADDSIKPDDDLAVARVESAILDALAAKGIKLVQDGEADFIVRYHAIVDKKTQQSSVRIGLGLSRRVGSHGAVSVGTSTSPKAKTVDVGTLVVDFLDPESGHVSWTAKGSETLKGDPEKRRAQIDASLAKALKKFPPPS